MSIRSVIKMLSRSVMLLRSLIQFTLGLRVRTCKSRKYGSNPTCIHFCYYLIYSWCSYKYSFISCNSHKSISKLVLSCIILGKYIHILSQSVLSQNDTSEKSVTSNLFNANHLNSSWLEVHLDVDLDKILRNTLRLHLPLIVQRNRTIFRLLPPFSVWWMGNSRTTKTVPPYRGSLWKLGK